MLKLTLGFLVVFLVYGDTMKWVLPGSLALAISYGLAISLLAVILTLGASRNSLKIPGGGSVFVGVLIVLSAHFVSAFVSTGISPLRVLIGFLYVAIPLLAFLVTKANCDLGILKSLLSVFCISMMPVHFVGAWQFYVDPNFLVFSTYSELGGVILRNELVGLGYFARLPSIFASADRYAAMSALNILAVLSLLFLPRLQKPKHIFLLLVCFVFAFGGLMFAGVRSRIFIIILLFAGLLALVIARSNEHTMRQTPVFTLLKKYGLAALICSWLTAGYLITQFPVLDMIAMSLETNDLNARITEATRHSLVDEEMSILGLGLGGLSPDGTPGEFGIRSLFLELGILLGWLSILGFAILIFGIGVTLMSKVSLRAYYIAPLAIYLMATFVVSLLVGLKFSLDLSSGLIGVLLYSVAVSASQSGTARRKSRIDGTRVRVSYSNGRIHP